MKGNTKVIAEACNHKNIIILVLTDKKNVQTVLTTQPKVIHCKRLKVKRKRLLSE